MATSYGFETRKVAEWGIAKAEKVRKRKYRNRDDKTKIRKLLPLYQRKSFHLPYPNRFYYVFACSLPRICS